MSGFTSGFTRPGDRTGITLRLEVHGEALPGQETTTYQTKSTMLGRWETTIPGREDSTLGQEAAMPGLDTAKLGQEAAMPGLDTATLGQEAATL
eukprot:g29172.t1